MAVLFYLPNAAPVASGSSYPGAKLYFYLTGTSTSATVYTDDGLTTAHANPVVADSSGVFDPIYLDSSVSYRVVLKTSAGVTLRDVDPIPAPFADADAVGSVLWPRTAAEISAAVTPSDYGYAPGNVRRYGAAGNGTTNDTLAVQAAIDVAEAAGGGEVFFPEGTYYVGQLTYYAGITFRGTGGGSKLLKVPSASSFNRMFNPSVAASSTDMAPVSWISLVLDGNSGNAGTYDGFELQQQHLIMLCGGPEGGTLGAGRLPAFIRDCVFQNVPADGVSVYTNVNLEISDCIFRECFRSGLAATGGYSFVKATNLHMGGTTDLSRMDIEVDGAGYGDATALTFQGSNIYSQHGFDFGGTDLTVRVSNLVSTDGACTWGSCDNLADMRFTNCAFALSETDSFKNRIVEGGNITFSDCAFTFHRPAALEGAQTFSIYIYWEVTTSNAGVKVQFDNCEFFVDASVESGDTVEAVNSQNNTTANGYRLVFNGCTINAGFDTGILQRGGTTTIRDTYIDAVVPMSFEEPLGGAGYVARIDNVMAGPTATSWMTIVDSDADSVITHVNCIVSEADNVINTTDGYQTTVHRGGRIIQGASAPTTSTPGLVGDRYILNTPVAGGVYEYVCVGYSGANVTWKAAITLAA